MTRLYSVAFKQKMVERLTGKNAISANQSAEETGFGNRTCRVGCAAKCPRPSARTATIAGIRSDIYYVPHAAARAVVNNKASIGRGDQRGGLHPPQLAGGKS